MDETRRDETTIDVSWNESVTALVLALARRVKEKMPSVNLARRLDDRELTLKVCYLVITGQMPEEWLWDAVEAVKHGRSKKTPVGYWWTCLKEGARERGESLPRLLARIDVPEEFLRKTTNHR